jgi:hypothetical protein
MVLLERSECVLVLCAGQFCTHLLQLQAINEGVCDDFSWKHTIASLFHCFGVEVHRTLCVVVKIELHDLPRVVTVVVTLVCPTNVEFAR